MPNTDAKMYLWVFKTERAKKGTSAVRPNCCFNAIKGNSSFSQEWFAVDSLWQVLCPPGPYRNWEWLLFQEEREGWCGNFFPFRRSVLFDQEFLSPAEKCYRCHEEDGVSFRFDINCKSKENVTKLHVEEAPPEKRNFWFWGQRSWFGEPSYIFNCPDVFLQYWHQHMSHLVKTNMA